MAINQKGANGIIAEYQSAVTLWKMLDERKQPARNNLDELESLLREAVVRVGNELTPDQVSRAHRQGEALGAYMCDAITNDPQKIGLLVKDADLKSGEFHILPTGHETNSGDPRDLTLTWRAAPQEVELPVSLKAYRGDQSSLGSKGGRASLGRLFCDNEKINDREFVSYFGNAASEYISVLSKFKQAAKDFYAGPESEEFLREYELRKGHRKVNNPLRRKEVGDFFLARHRFVSEHKLAELYVQMHEDGRAKIASDAIALEKYLNGLRFILGNPEMLVLDAKANDDGTIREIVNSLDNPAYRALNRVLRSGLEFSLAQKSGKSTITVSASCDGAVFNGLSLAMWKDGTIQYKIDTKKG